MATSHCRINKQQLRRQLAGFRRVNDLEFRQKRAWLSSLSLAEKWEQFEALCELARQLAPAQNPNLAKVKLELMADLRRQTVRMEAWRQERQKDGGIC